MQAHDVREYGLCVWCTLLMFIRVFVSSLPGCFHNFQGLPVTSVFVNAYLSGVQQRILEVGE